MALGLKPEAVSLGHYKVQLYIKEINKREDRFFYASLIQTTDFLDEFQMTYFPELQIDKYGL